MTLLEIKSGECGKVYWYEKTNRQLTEEEIEQIRSKSIRDWTNIAISSAMYNDGPKVLSPDVAISRGWDEARKQIDLLESATEIKSEWVLIGDSNTISRIAEIESSSNFVGWVNSNIMDQIKSHYESIQ